MKNKFTLYTLAGLAKHLGISYNYLKSHLSSLNRSGKDLRFKGFRFFGVSNKGWYAYPEDLQIDIEDAPELLPRKSSSATEQPSNSTKLTPDPLPVEPKPEPEAL